LNSRRAGNGGRPAPAREENLQDAATGEEEW